MAVLQVVSQSTFDRVLESRIPVLVSFHAHWCLPCRAVHSTLAEIEYDSVAVMKVDVDENPDVTAHYQVTSVPHLILFRDGQVVTRHRGAADRAKLIELLESG